MFSGTHYEIKVDMDWLKEDTDGLKQVVESLNKDNIGFILLPVINEKYKIDVLKTEKDNFYIICDEKRVYMVTAQLPIDMDLALLIDDLINQREHKDPMPLKSKFKKIFDDAWGKAHKIQMEGLPEEEKFAYSLFYKKADEIMTDEEKEKDEWSWDDEDPVADKADFLYSYKLAADVLLKNGYGYENVKLIAELDHHDVPTYKNDLEWLYDGFFWRGTMAKYM